MDLFFTKDIPVNISSNNNLWGVNNVYDHFIDGSFKDIDLKKTNGKILIRMSQDHFRDILLVSKKVKNHNNISLITLLVDDIKEVNSFIKNKFKIIYAAGGLVKNQDNALLMIYRMGKWELPKGKIELDEEPHTAAIREIEEETGVIAETKDLIGITWYNYFVKGQIYFKKISWYDMTSLNDSNMKPQVEEGITKVKWIPENKIQETVNKSFSSIKHIYKKFQNNITNGRTQ